MQNAAQDVNEILVQAGGYRGAIILMSAVKLGIFETLSGRALTAAELAHLLRADSRAIKILLNALTALEFLELEDNHYKNAQKSDEYMVKGKENYLGDIVKHNFHLIQRWIYLSDVVMNGKPVRRDAETWNSEQQRDFIMGMANLGKNSAGQLMEVLDLSSVRRLLDVGGGPGTFSITFCHRHPNMRAVVFDLPEVTEIAKEQIHLAGLDDKVTTVGGDYNIDSLGEGYDLVFISNIIHSLGEEATAKLFQKSFQALQSGGRIVVKDFISEENMISPLHAAIFSVNMLVGTEEGRCYSRGEIEKWLTTANFKNLKYVAVNDQNQLIIGIKS